MSLEVVARREAARDFAIALTNFDGATIDADFDRIADAATSDFAEGEWKVRVVNVLEAPPGAQLGGSGLAGTGDAGVEEGVGDASTTTEDGG